MVVGSVAVVGTAENAARDAATATGADQLPQVWDQRWSRNRTGRTIDCPKTEEKTPPIGTPVLNDTFGTVPAVSIHIHDFGGCCAV